MVFCGSKIPIGILSWLSFLLCNHPLGVSTAIAKSAGMIEKALRGSKVEEKLYYRENKPTVDWEWMLVLGLLIGAFTAAKLSGTFQWEWMSPMWAEAFGTNVWKRLAVALCGGILLGFGARWGCGCTSGHGISGSLQLVLASWLAGALFFIGGIASAFVLYRLL
ncbi:MAG: hypothetical protein EOM20_04555 [Spartobacteria bacterium]|nr:hypothetical protein [Spartobacteria bacterium]